uniref:Pentatricopeptide repeat-containing protein n=1 Tax=Oryza punctata TaxID=4537 RepID=A0A0E0JG36_ORYPU
MLLLGSPISGRLTAAAAAAARQHVPLRPPLVGAHRRRPLRHGDRWRGGRALNSLLAAAVARGDHVLAVSLFNRAARDGGAGGVVVYPTVHTYGILVDCGCRAGSMGLALASVGRIVKTGWRVEAVAFTRLIRRLCAEKKVGDAMDLVAGAPEDAGAWVRPQCRLLQRSSQGAMRMVGGAKRLSICSTPWMESEVTPCPMWHGHGWFLQGG